MKHARLTQAGSPPAGLNDSWSWVSGSDESWPRPRANNSTPLCEPARNDWTSAPPQACWRNRQQGAVVLKPDLANQIIQRVADEVVTTTCGIQGFAEAAQAFARNGNRSEAIAVLLDIEPKLNELSALVELASFVNRRTD